MQEVLIFSLILLLICNLVIFGCTKGRESTELSEQVGHRASSRSAKLASIIKDKKLDSISADFLGDSLYHHYIVTDPRVLLADPCYGDFPNPFVFSGFVDLALDMPCTVSVIVTDESGVAIDWRHFVHSPPPDTAVMFLPQVFPNLDGLYRYNILINGELVVSCLWRAFEYIEEK